MENNEELIYQYGLDICTYYEELVMDRRTEGNRSLHHMKKLEHKNITESMILKKIINEQDDISLFIFIITKQLKRIYPREAQFLKMKYYDALTIKDIKLCMNMKNSSFYRLRKRAFIEIGKIYLNINGETINDLKRN